jgi:signal peptidase I
VPASSSSEGIRRALAWLGEGSDPTRRLRRLVLLAAALALGGLGVDGLLLQRYTITGGSMLPTLRADERVLAVPVWYRIATPQRGELVVLHPNGDRGLVYDGPGVADNVRVLKRIVALPGETIGARRGRIYVCPADPTRTCFAPQPARRAHSGDFGPVTLGEDRYFLLGDNLAGSEDSRAWGAVRRAQLRARVLLRS